MSKRPIDEVEDNASCATGDQQHPYRKKKRKEKLTSQSGGQPEISPVTRRLSTNAEDSSESQNKEKKSKRRDKSGRKGMQDSSPNGKASSNDTTELEVEVDGADELPKEKLTREDRKAAKAAKKAAKAAKNAAKSNGASVGSSTDILMENPAISAPLPTLSQSVVDNYIKKNHITITDPLDVPILDPILQFSHLPLLDGKQKSSFISFTAPFSAPTPIQAVVWPYLISGRDCIGVAETGSGKTLAFAVPGIRHICAKPAKERKGVKLVVVSPTRELAMQIHENMDKLATEVGLTAVCLYGGVPKDEQRKSLKKATIVIATPGRLNDLMDEGSADLGKVEYLVLDEADRMLDKGFEDDIKKIIGATPSKGRQTLMFTATWPPSVRELASTFMNTPVRVNIGDSNDGDLRANARITQKVQVLDHRAKEQRLLQLLQEHQSGNNKHNRILVFCLYKKEASRVESMLRSKGYRVAGIHGDLSQAQRTQALASFKDGKCPLLIATDVAARGLDIPKVKLVINVTFPLTIEDYVHRIGRTGRAGESGLAITFFTEHDKAHSGSLVNILKAANQEVPESLLKFGTTVKKKEHSLYGAFYRETDGVKTATKIKFDD